MARVGGKPKMVSERYLGTAAEIAAAVEGREAAALPERTRHLAFGDVAAAWGMLGELGVIAVIDAAAGARPSGQPLSTGTYLALAALNRLAAPCSKAAFANWWKTTAADRLTRIGASSLDHRRFWDAMHAVTLEQLEQASETIAAEIIKVSGADVSSVALDMTNFATFIATANGRAPIAQRGKAKQKRSDLRLAGLGLVVTRDGGLPLTWHAYPGDRPDVTQFPDMTGQLKSRYQAVCAAAGADARATDMTVVFDAGQNSEANFAHFAKTGLHYIGSVPASDCPDLTALPGSRRTIVGKDRFGGLTAYDTRRTVYGAERRAILTHSPELRDSQARGFDGTTLAKAGKKLDELTATLARGKTRRPREKVQAEIGQITSKPWVRRVIRWQLDGDQPKDLRLTWHVDQDARAAVRSRVLLPADERPARRVVLPDAPLDRPQHPGPRLHLRPGPPARPPHALPGPPGRAGPIRPGTARRARRHRRNHPDLPLHRGTAQSPPHDHRAHRPSAAAIRRLRPGTVGTAEVRSYARTNPRTPLTSGNPYRGPRSSESPASGADPTDSACPSRPGRRGPPGPLVGIHAV